jgi:hypothetical protein
MASARQCEIISAENIGGENISWRKARYVSVAAAHEAKAAKA